MSSHVPLPDTGLKQRQLSKESTRTASRNDEDSSEVATPFDNLSNVAPPILSQESDQPICHELDQ